MTDKFRQDVLRWLHLSDLHIRLDQLDNIQLVFSRLRRLLQDEGLTFDLVFVTGDLAWNGAKSEYDEAYKILNALLSTVGCKNDRLFIVPGNHDVNLKKNVGLVSTFTGQEGANTFFRLPPQDRPHMVKFRDYEKFLLPMQCGQGATVGSYLCEVDIPESGCHVRVLGMNSAWFAQGGRGDRSNLLIGYTELLSHRERLEAGGAINIALVHHPFDWLQDYEAGTCATDVPAWCPFVLSGHMHRTNQTRLIDSDIRCQYIEAGAAYINDARWPRV